MYGHECQASVSKEEGGTDTGGLLAGFAKGCERPFGMGVDRVNWVFLLLP